MILPCQLSARGRSLSTQTGALKSLLLGFLEASRKQYHFLTTKVTRKHKGPLVTRPKDDGVDVGSHQYCHSTCSLTLVCSLLPFLAGYALVHIYVT